MRNRQRLLCAAAGVTLVVAGCGGKDKSSGTTGADQAPAAQTSAPDTPKPTVEFVTPKDGATVAAKFTAKVRLTNFTIDPGAIGKSPVPGRGHLHFRLDGGRFDTAEHSGENGKIAKKLGVDGKYSPAAAPEITYAKIPPGDHKLEVYLANNNHTDTGVEAEAEITVK